jgi:hypothetical protein
MVANTGAYLTTLLYGYTGLVLGPGAPETWARRPVVMPGGWKGLHVDRLWIHGEERSLSAKIGASAVLDGQALRRAS